DVAGQFGAEVDDHAGDLFRAAHSRGRDAGVVLHPAPALLGRGEAGLTVQVGDSVLGLDPAGGDGVDGDAVLRVLVGHRLEQADRRGAGSVGDNVVDCALPL